ncbi:hypothetical protein Scep_012189 [Stephania cephalantha]|uniref:Uncharacterized protein n=1 Tax=Stephania cephalantha TaxID=152367 RepID=A0AAP0JG43_9MAGN
MGDEIHCYIFLEIIWVGRGTLACEAVGRGLDSRMSCQGTSMELIEELELKSRFSSYIYSFLLVQKSILEREDFLHRCGAAECVQ